MSSDETLSLRAHAFVVRIWWEEGLTWPNGRPLWRGQVQHATSGQKLVFQSLDDLLRFIQSQTGTLGKGRTILDQPEGPAKPARE